MMTELGLLSSEFTVLASALLFAFVTPGSATAQRTWIVDTAGGGDFLDLPPAVEAAASGDTILVRPTQLSPVSAARIDKGLQILSDTRGTGSHLVHGVMIVENLRPDEPFILGKFGSSEGLEPQFGLVFRNCAGPIHCANIDLQFAGAAIQSPTFVSVIDCASVSFHACEPLIDVYVRNSTVLFTNCIIHGDALPRRTFEIGFPAIRSEDSILTLAQCAVQGGFSFRDNPPVIPGIEMTRGHLRITARAGVPFREAHNRVIGGSTSVFGPAIHSDEGLVELDPEIVLLARDRTTPGWTTGTSRFVRRPMPFLFGNLANVRQTQDLEAHVYAPAGANAWVFLGPPRIPFSLPGAGDVWLDPAALLPVGNGVVPQDGPLRFSVPVGDNICPSGTVFALQAVVSNANGFELTTPMQQVLLPFR